ncbi:MAG: hypothetical protein AAGE59_10485 [Cyanobacteria bacterium P01_F01_bin.86]
MSILVTKPPAIAQPKISGNLQISLNSAAADVIDHLPQPTH